jgi:hypothetical protein
MKDKDWKKSMKAWAEKTDYETGIPVCLGCKHGKITDYDYFHMACPLKEKDGMSAFIYADSTCNRFERKTDFSPALPLQQLFYAVKKIAEFSRLEAIQRIGQ